MTEDYPNQYADRTYNDIEEITKYLPTSKTTGYVKLRLAVREFPRDETKVKTYDF